MNIKKNEDKSLSSKKSIKANISQSKSFNPEMKNINRDLLFFKNDILLDIRKIEENFNSRLNKQNIISSEQYDSLDKKLSELSERISRVNSILLDNNELTEKIKIFLRFQTKAEDNFNRINAKIISIQNENRDFIINSEKMISENLKYPGVIGRNAKFLNFRYFIDYTMKNFKDLDEFRNEIINLNLKELRKEINKTISDFRTTISDNYQNSARLISNSTIEFDKKVEDIIIRNYNNMKENEAKFEELKNNINNYLSEYHTKFESLEKNLNDKFDEQLKEIDNVKNMKNELLSQTNNVKSYLENIKSLNNNIITNNSNIELNKNGRNKKNILSDENNNFDYNIISTDNQKHNINMNELINNNNINILDNYQKSDVQHNTDSSSRKRNNQIVMERPKSFEKIKGNHFFKTRNKNRDFFSYLNKTNKDFRRSNYSITNIANIKIKKVLLPEKNLSKRNIIGKSDSPSENKRRMIISNDLSSKIPQKNVYLNNIRKKILYQQKALINKNRDRNIEHSARTINRKVEIKNQEKLNSCMITKPKSKNNIFEKLNCFKDGNNLSFEKNKNSKDEQSQIEFRKTHNLKCSVKDLFLIHSKTCKKNRKIEL